MHERYPDLRLCGSSNDRPDPTNDCLTTYIFCTVFFNRPFDDSCCTNLPSRATLCLREVTRRIMLTGLIL